VKRQPLGDSPAAISITWEISPLSMAASRSLSIRRWRASRWSSSLFPPSALKSAIVGRVDSNISRPAVVESAGWERPFRAQTAAV
jgi:hypothetical protein